MGVDLGSSLVEIVKLLLAAAASKATVDFAKDAVYSQPRGVLFEYLRDLRDILIGVDGELKELATDIQLRPEAELIEQYYGRLARIAKDLEIATLITIELRDIAETAEVKKLFEVADIAHSVAKVMLSEYRYATEADPAIDGTVNRYLDELEKRVVELTGEKCRYRLSYRLTSHLNDLASCIHRVAEYVNRKYIGSELYGRCLLEKDAHRDAVTACKLWSRATVELEAMRLYEEEDAGALGAYTVDAKVFMRVGSSPGHRTLVDLERGRVEYYDTDADVNKIVHQLLTEQGLRCEMIPDRGVFCGGLTRDRLPHAMAILAAATSMDFRLADPAKYWGEKAEEILEKHPELTSIELEKILLKELIPRIVKRIT